MINKTILHYKIIERLGEGGMGVVYLAEDTKLERDVAIKFLPSNITSNSDERERFKIEAKAAASLNHPNIATIHAIEEVNDEMFIVMEYIDGVELKEIISGVGAGLASARATARVAPTIKEIINIATQIAEGLKAAHDKGIVHRDIKSANIMITESGQTKIMDFGLAKMQGSDVQLTKEHSTLGTAAYMSPEQTNGEDVDHRTDIWSFGVGLYEMLTGEMPFKGDYEQAVIYSILNEEPESISSINSGVSHQLEEIVKRTLAKNPDDRFKNAGELVAKLKTIGDQFKAVGMKSDVSINKDSKRKLTYVYAGISIIFLLIMLLNILFFSNKEDKKLINSIAVLPFSNTKPDPETDYLGFALADQIIGDLVYLKNIIVRPSSSVRKYEKKAIDPEIVGDDLKVDYILTGNYLKEAEIVRLNIELVNTKSNEMIWREPIEVNFQNTFDLQDIVAKKVVNRLDIQFSKKEMNRIVKDIPESPLAYEYYLRSISYPFSNNGDQLAIKMLYKSIELDPNYSPAYAQLGDRIHRLFQYKLLPPEEMKNAENYNLKALSLNEESIFALANLAGIYTETNRIGKALEFTKKILEINPNDAEAHFSLGYIYRYAGMNKEAVLEMEKAVSIDPENPGFRSSVITYVLAGEDKKSFEISKNYEQSTFIILEQGHALLRMGKQQQAVEYFDRVIDMEPDGLPTLYATCMKAFIEGEIDKGIDAVKKFETYNIADSEAWYFMSGNYGLLGDKTGCVRALQRAVDGGFFNYPFMLTDFFLDSVRDDPEFQKILEKANQKHLAFKKRFF